MSHTTISPMTGYALRPRRRRAWLRAAACLTAIAATIPGATAEETDQWLDSVFQVKEVTVIANRRKEIIPSQRLDGEQLRNLNSQSVADALRYFSGIQVKDFGGIGGVKTVNIRSMGSQNVGVFYDGIQLGNAQNGQIDLGRYSLDNVEEIELYNGQKSNIFQSAKDFGSSGTIYIRTRRPRFASGERYHLTARVKAGSFGLINPDITWEQRLSRTLNMSLSTGYTYANGRYKFRYRRLNTDNTVAYDTTATRHNGDVSALRAELSLFGYLDAGTWTAKAYYYDSERGIPGAIVNNVFRNGERQWDRNAFAQGSLEYLFSSRYHLKVNAKYAYDYMHFLRDDPKELYIDNRYRQQEVYLSAANLLRIKPWWDASLSVDLQWNKMSSDMRDFLYPVRYTGMVAVATAVRGYGLSAQASLLATLVSDRVGNESVHGRHTSRRTEWSPALFADWHPGAAPEWHVNGFVKRSFRMPTFNDLYYTEIGNANLRPETTMQYSLGASYNKSLHHTFFKSVTARAEGYYNRVDDKIIAYPSGQQFRWTMLNLGRVGIVGAELSASAGASVGGVEMSVQLNYTYQLARDFTDPTDSYYGDRIPYSPLHAGAVGAHLSWRGWDLNYSFIYTGARYNAQENIPRNYEQPWYTHDASLYKEFALRRVGLRAGVELNNIFDQAYEVIANYPMPGRNFKVTLAVTL